MILPAGQRGKPVHGVLHDGRAGEVVGVDSFAGLEEDVGVLGGAAEEGAVRDRARLRWARTSWSSIMARRSSSRSVLDLADLVRGAEAVEEVQERDPRLQGSGLGDQGEVVRLLHGVGAEQGEAGAAAAITSLWSPKIDRACVARARAAT